MNILAVNFENKVRVFKCKAPTYTYMDEHNIIIYALYICDSNEWKIFRKSR